MKNVIYFVNDGIPYHICIGVRQMDRENGQDFATYYVNWILLHLLYIKDN